MGFNIVIVVIFAVFLFTDVYCHNNGGQISRQTLIEDLLDPTIYDPSVPPGKPTNVKIQLIINDTIMENEQASEISGLTTVILHWIDSRLDYSAKASYPSFIIRGSAKLKPWVPDIFILENREPYITGFGSKNELIVFNRSGNVVFNHRFTTRMLCEMNLDYYPYDEQHCQITLQSYAFTQEDVQLSWLSDNPVMDHVQSTKTVSLKKSETVASYAIDSGGNFSTLTTILIIKRNYPANNTIIGTPIVLVVISTFSLLFDDNFTPRITLCGAAMTTIIMHWAGIYNKVQPVATLLWLDNWMFGNLIAVGCIILYTAIRHHVCKHFTEKEKAAEKNSEESKEKTISGGTSQPDPGQIMSNLFRASQLLKDAAQLLESTSETVSHRFWSHRFCALASCDQKHVPTMKEKEHLLQSGLGEQTITFVKSADPVYFKMKIEEKFPKLKDIGGYELFKSSPDPLQLELIPIPPDVCTTEHLADCSMLGQALCFLRPKQGLSLEDSHMEGKVLEIKDEAKRKNFVVLDVIVSILIPIVYILFAVIYVWQWQQKEYRKT